MESKRSSVVRRAAWRLGFHIGAGCLAGLLATVANATTYFPISDAELIRRSPIVVLARAGAWTVVSSGEIFRTETRRSFEVLETIRGSAGRSISIAVPGGMLANGRGGTLVFGMPSFEEEAEYLLFLYRRDDGLYGVSELALGAFDVLVDETGTEFAAQLRSHRLLASGPAREEQIASEPLRNLERFMDYIRFLSVSPGRRAGNSIDGREREGYEGQPRGALLRKGQRGLRPLWSLFGPLTGRWINGATARVAWSDYTPATPGQSGVPGGGFQEVINAIAAWNDNPTSQIHYEYGGPDVGYWNWVNVVFDKTSEFGGTGWCGSGVAAIAYAGVLTDPAGGVISHMWKGDSYYGLGGGTIVTRRWDCPGLVYPQVGFQNVLTHELGHTLGLGHPDEDVQSPHDTTPGDEPAAIMSGAGVPLDRLKPLGADDIEAICWLYGSCGSATSPQVTSLSPSSGSSAGGDTVTITGTNFGGGTTAVLFGGSQATVVSSTPTQITVVTPSHAPGSTNVTVWTADSIASLPAGYAYVSSALSFYSLAPCRILDTRGAPGGSGGPSLFAGTSRTFATSLAYSKCGVPFTARALSINLTVTQPTAPGDLRIFPGGASLPLVSAINYRPGQTRANNAVAVLGTDGDFRVQCDQAGGTVHFIADVNGYFAVVPAHETFTEFSLFPRNNPFDIAIGPDGNIWFTSNTGIQEVTVDGAIAYVASVFPQGATFLVNGPDGNLWFTNPGVAQIGKTTSSGVVTQYPVLTPSSEPYVISAGPDGSLWFTEHSSAGNRIGRITPTGTVAEFPVPTPNSAPRGIAQGPDGNLWFTEELANKIGRITTAGVITEFPIPTAFVQPTAIVAGPDGNLWFTETFGGIGRITTSGVVREFPIPTPGQLANIVAGPDGNLWFTESSGNRIARITLSGTVTEFPVPTPDSQPTGITVGPDGNIWFTEFAVYGSKIGRFTP